MITRIVKMTFVPGKEAEFLEIFNVSKEKIRGFEGCHGLKLLQSGNIFFTYSQWESATHLETYRNSELFASTWKKTKVLFAEKAEAWSTTVLSNE